MRYFQHTVTILQSSLTIVLSFSVKSLRVYILIMEYNTGHLLRCGCRPIDISERQSKTLPKSLEVAHVEENDGGENLENVLLQYRSTPHDFALERVTPAFLVFGSYRES